MGWTKLEVSIFHLFLWLISKIGRKQKKKTDNSKTNQRNWQICHGRDLVDHLNQVIRHCHMLDDFWIKTLPDQDPFILQVFEIDGPDKHVRLRMGIGFPNFFVIDWPDDISWLDEKGNLRPNPLPCASFEEFLKCSEEVLLRVLFQRSPIRRMR